MTKHAPLIIVGVLITVSTSEYAQAQVQLAPLFPIQLGTQVDASGALVNRTTAQIKVTAAATLPDARSKLYVMLPQMNQQLSCPPSGGGVGGKITNVGLSTPPGNPRAFVVTATVSAQRCGTPVNADMTVSTTIGAKVIRGNRIELMADAPQVACQSAACFVFRSEIVAAITPKIDEVVAAVGSWIDRQIQKPMGDYQKPPYSLKIDSADVYLVRGSDFSVKVLLSGQVPIAELEAVLAAEVARGVPQ